MKQELTTKIQHKRQSPKKNKNNLEDLEEGDYEYYDEEIDQEKTEKQEIDELYKISMKLNSRRRRNSDQEEGSEAQEE